MGRHVVHPVVHWELWSPEPEALSDFYRQVFDWRIQYLPDLDDRMVVTGSGTGMRAAS